MTARIESVLYGDRSMGTFEHPETGENEPGWAELVYEAIRALNHITSSRATYEEGIPAPVAYRALGDLAQAASILPQLTEQLGEGLVRSLEHFDVYDDKREPALSVQVAAEHLATAAVEALRLAASLSAAQTALNSQGYR